MPQRKSAPARLRQAAHWLQEAWPGPGHLTVAGPLQHLLEIDSLQGQQDPLRVLMMVQA